MKQFYIVTLQKMMTCEEGDLAFQWSCVMEHGDLPKLTINLAADIIDNSSVDIPGTNIRPMTEDEIRDWRSEQ